MRYATQSTAGVREGAVVWVDYRGAARKCRIAHVADYLCYDVVYLDSGQRELGVPHARVDVER